MSTTHYSSTSAFTLVLAGRPRRFIAGERITAAAYGRLPGSIQRRFVAAAPAARGPRAVAGAGVTVSDAAVLGLLLDCHARGLTVDGGYAVVWAWVASELGAYTGWAHYRASQLARVGRAFERATGVSFATVCPGLPAVAGAWVSDLA